MKLYGGPSPKVLDSWRPESNGIFYCMASTIQKITRSLPAPVAQLGESILGDKCYGVLVRDVVFLTPPYPAVLVPCAKLALSKIIGIGIVCASSIIKLPQITKLVSSRSAAGVSVSGAALEAASYLGMLAYAVRAGFPFSTFGEQAFLWIQDVAVLLLLLVYSGRSTIAVGVVPVVLAAAYYLVLSVPGPSEKFLAMLQAAAIPLNLASKVPQIITIFQNKSTGQLSAVSVFAYMAGSVARVFTTIQEVDDRIMLAGVVLGALLNLVLVVQMVMYWGTSTPAAEKDKKEH
ncbi:hypothetical protein V1525DRAFT_397199 [Lipomyces kononenkoae]|uniref:Uncharacterized protein n=1 Tax=Lipomyces kononenkoae TaxID=34357 RepID=A0ACC3T6S2_LIPKO